MIQHEHIESVISSAFIKTGQILKLVQRQKTVTNLCGINDDGDQPTKTHKPAFFQKMRS